MARRSGAATARRSNARSRHREDPVARAGAGRIDANGRPVKAPTSASSGVDPEALVVTHWFDSGEGGEPYAATIRLRGQRVGVHGLPRASDTFVKEEAVEGIVPGSGPVSITTVVYGLQPGDWAVTGELIRPETHAPGPEPRERWRRRPVEPLVPARWSWRKWAVSTAPAGPVHTRWAMLAPLARMPGVIPGSFTVLGALGIVVALVVQSAILARASIPVGQSLVVSLIALVSGLLGAKVWYAVLHPGPWRTALLGGWAVDGFLVVAPAVAVAVLLAFDLPVGRFLDATAPGMFIAVAIGRLGCFLTGCCAGRCTRSRWGVWSFDRDRRIGARRVPAQLLESAAGLVVGLVAVPLVLNDAFGFGGAVFAGAVIAYLLVRQLLLRLRAERRDYLWRRSRLVSGARS
jgi:phosphatidylglycerol:prolipoprotein diacylglycerol transferase